LECVRICWNKDTWRNKRKQKDLETTRGNEKPLLPPLNMVLEHTVRKESETDPFLLILVVKFFYPHHHISIETRKGFMMDRNAKRAMRAPLHQNVR
jgi:hypothetical protein